MSSTNTKKTLRVLKGTEHLWHEESTLVFKSKTEKLVIGRFVDGEIIALDELALDLCEKWKFAYDEELVASEKDEENVSEHGEVEGDNNNSEGENNEQDTDENENENENDNENEEDEEQDNENESKDDNQVTFSDKFENLTSIISNLSKTVDDEQKNNVQKISKLKSQLSTKNSEFDKLKKQFEEKNEEYLKLKTKFDGIKSLFS